MPLGTRCNSRDTGCVGGTRAAVVSRVEAYFYCGETLWCSLCLARTTSPNANVDMNMNIAGRVRMWLDQRGPTPGVVAVTEQLDVGRLPVRSPNAATEACDAG